MQHATRSALFLAVLYLSLATTVNAAGNTPDITQGAMLSNSCAACHGTDGNSPGAIPSLNGKSADFIVRSLREFRDGSRAATVMDRHARGYSDAEIQLIADYFAGLPRE